MQHALAFAETGHLCLATLHANNANQALDRVLGVFSRRIAWTGFKRVVVKFKRGCCAAASETK